MTHPQDELLTRHLTAVWRLARVLSRSASDAEDLVQDVFLTAWQRRADLRDPAAARAWILRITVNTHRDGLRRRSARRRATERAAMDPASPVGRTTAGPAAESGKMTRDLERVAAEAMAALPPRQREVLHLAAVEQLDHAAIAGILDLSPGNVRSTLSIARGRVAEAIDAATGQTTEASR